MSRLVKLESDFMRPINNFIGIIGKTRAGGEVVVFEELGKVIAHLESIVYAAIGGDIL